MLNLMNARKAIHKTQQEVADYLGISRQAYSNYEAGKREPDFETLLKLGEYFGCSVDYPCHLYPETSLFCHKDYL